MFYTQPLDRLRHLGLKPEVSIPILKLVQKWVLSSGPEWTVQRLKSLKLFYINRVMNKDDSLEQWISCRNGIPTGPFRPIFQMSNLNKVMNVLLIYTSFISKNVTKSQAQKFFNSVEAPLGPNIHIPNLKKVAEGYKGMVPKYRNMNYSEYPWSPTRRTLGPVGKTEPEGIDALLQDCLCSRVIDHIDMFEDIYHDAIGDLYLTTLKGQELNNHPSHFCVGQVSVIQEPGFKARFIANPRRIYQIMLRGLGKQLFGLLQILPWDCTYNQLSGIEWVQRNLSAGKMVHCVDLSDATNHFPLDLQVKIARWIGVDEEALNLFIDVARSPWYLPKNLQTYHHDNTVKWSKGQPLGLYPSFPLFGVSHGLLVEALRCEVKAPKDSFRILGDDIVISDLNLYKKYIAYLNLLQIPVSLPKCISSDKVAEFAGSIITPTKFFSGVKWRNPTAANRISLIQSLPCSLDLSKKNEFLSYLMRQAPKPYGSNSNAEGLPLSLRIPLFFPWYYYIKEKEGYTELKRSTKKELQYTSNIIKDNIGKSEVLSRKELEALLPQSIQIDEEKQDTHREMSSWFVLSRLIEIFKFQKIKVPDWFTETHEFSDRHREYLLSSPPEFTKPNVFAKYIYKRQCKGSLLWFSLSKHRRELYLDEMKDMFLNER